MENPMNVKRRFIVSIIATLFLSLCFVAMVMHDIGGVTPGAGSIRKTTIRAFWIRISDVESLEFSWEQRSTPSPYAAYVEYYGYLTRTLYGKSERYFVGVDSHLPEELTLRADKGGHVWLVAPAMDVWGQKSGPEVRPMVIASLNRDTGQFTNQYGVPVTSKLSPVEQEALDRPRITNTGTITKVTPYPQWATVNGGTVLVKTGDIALYLTPID